jgi:hypothetical protein
VSTKERADAVLFIPRGNVVSVRVLDQRAGSVARAPRVFVNVELLDDLFLNFGKQQHAFLEPARCHIPELGQDATSVNHAYTLISTAFESLRRAKGGNVFLKVFFPDQSGNPRPLDSFRKEVLSRLESEGKLEPDQGASARVADERGWVAGIVDLLNEKLRADRQELKVWAGRRLAYANEIREYQHANPISDPVAYETDFLVTEEIGNGIWKPRVVIEAKLSKVSTHDAITYSEKAFHHKKVHPYLRYGIIIGDRKHYPLPGRLFRHGAYFDFMLSWVEKTPTETEQNVLLNLILVEVDASRDLEHILFTSRKRDRAKYTILHKPLVLQ